MTHKDKLKQLELELKAGGVVDVKFTLNPTVKPSIDELSVEVIDVLRAYLNSELKPVSCINDSR